MNSKRNYILVIVAAILGIFVFIDRFLPDTSFQGMFQSLENEIALKKRKLIKYQKIVKRRNKLDGQLISLNRSLERAESGLLNGETPALAAVDIQNILNEIAERSKAEVQSMRVLKPEELDKESPVKDYYMGIPVEITLSATVRQIKEVLYRIETSQKLLNVTDMRIRVSNVREKEKIYATLTVSGFMKKREEFRSQNSGVRS